MKNLFKNLGLGIIIGTILILSFGCTEKEETPSNLKVFTNVGFVSELALEYGEDGKNYVEFSVNGSSLKLEVKDTDVFTKIKEDEFYQFAYDQDNVLLSIEEDDYIKGLVLKSMEEGLDDEDSVTKNHISPENKVSTQGLILLDSYEFDINGDGFEETIGMYVNAEQGSDGEIYWDDGQDWLFLVQGQEEDYILFDDYVQLGNIKFHIYTVDEDFYITTIQSGTANLDIVDYKFDRDLKEFVSTLKHGTTGNLNMLHSSFGY